MIPTQNLIRIALRESRLEIRFGELERLDLVVCIILQRAVLSSAKPTAAVLIINRAAHFSVIHIAVNSDNTVAGKRTVQAYLAFTVAVSVIKKYTVDIICDT